MSKKIYAMAFMVLAIALGMQVLPVKAIIGGIGDYVWIDTNADGIQDPEELGIGGITVNLYDCNMTLLATTTTDADGLYLFRFADLTPPLPGCYLVEFIIPECYSFSPPRQTSSGLDSDPDPSTGLTPMMNIHDNYWYMDFDAGLIPCEMEEGYSPGFWKHEVRAHLLDKGAKHYSPAEMVSFVDYIDTTYFNDTDTFTLEWAYMRQWAKEFKPMRLEIANWFNEAAGLGPYMDDD